MVKMSMQLHYLTVTKRRDKKELPLEAGDYSLIAILDELSKVTSDSPFCVGPHGLHMYIDTQSTIEGYAHDYVANCAEQSTAAKIHDLQTNELVGAIDIGQAAFPYTYFQVRHKKGATKALLFSLKVGRVSHSQVFIECLKSKLVEKNSAYVLRSNVVVSDEIAKKFINEGTITQLDIIKYSLPSSIEHSIKSNLESQRGDYTHVISIIPKQISKGFSRKLNQSIAGWMDGARVPSDVIAFPEDYEDVALDVTLNGRTTHVLLSKVGMKSVSYVIDSSERDDRGLPLITDLRACCDSLANEYYR